METHYVDDSSKLQSFCKQFHILVRCKCAVFTTAIDVLPFAFSQKHPTNTKTSRTHVLLSVSNKFCRTTQTSRRTEDAAPTWQHRKRSQRTLTSWRLCAYWSRTQKSRNPFSFFLINKKAAVANNFSSPELDLVSDSVFLKAEHRTISWFLR